MLEVPKKIILLPVKFAIMPSNRKRSAMTHLKISAVAFIFLFAAFTASSQTLELGVMGGGSYYLGEMNTAVHFSGTQLAFGVLARYNLNKRWSVKFGYNRGKIKGDDSKNAFIPDKGLNFESKLNDITLVGEFNFLDYFTGSKKTYFTPYIFAGVGFFTFSPKSYSGVDLQAIGTEGQNAGFDGRSPYNKWGISFPFGLGVKYSLSERFGLGVEWGMRKTFTDYLDDASTSYYLTGSDIDPNNTAHVLSDPSGNHEPYMQRGNSKTMDWFNFFGVSVTYKFNLRSKTKCNQEGW